MDADAYRQLCQDWERDAIDDLEMEINSLPVVQRFRYVSFLSRTKGKGRQRRKLSTVELYQDKTIQKYYSERKAKFDVWATEVYNIDRTQPDDFGLSDKLREDIRRFCEK